MSLNLARSQSKIVAEKKSDKKKPEPNSKEQDLTVIIALKVNVFGDIPQAEESIRKIQSMVGLGLHQDVKVAAWAIGFADGAAYSRQNGALRIVDLLQEVPDEKDD